MSKHRKVRLLLYDYIRSELGVEESEFVRQHIESCRSCAAEADEIRSVLRVFPGDMEKPSERLGDAYWAEFAVSVERRGRLSPHSAPGRADRAATWLNDFFAFRNKYAYGIAAAGSAAVLLLVLTTVRWDAFRSSPDAHERGRQVVGDEMIAGNSGKTHPDFPPDDDAGWLPGAVSGEIQETATRQAGETVRPEAVEGALPEKTFASGDSLTEFDRRLNKFFRRSRTLLVGVSNMDPAGDGGYGFEGERKVSWSLLREARYLKTGPVDQRSSRLLEDLNQLMTELANSDSPSRHPGVELVREGIENKNLLFKLRMRESHYDRLQVKQASYHKEGDMK